MSLAALLSRWRADPSVWVNVVEQRTLPARPARFLPLPPNLHPTLAQSLQANGIRQLYLHQAAAWELARDGRNPVIVTGTASGKTLCYNLPVLDRLLRLPQGRALYLFPTKALAQDQLENLKQLLPALLEGCADPQPPSENAPAPLQAAVYDGDTPSHARPALRAAARLVISNPDMLHTGVLPHHTSWAEFFGNLQFVVIDEMHAYRGVFGSHVANVLRRLKRIARFYGARPQFILTSATLANPAELAEKLIEEPVSLVDEDGSGRGPRHFLIYNPPIVDRELGLRRSAMLESVRLAEDLLANDVQTIVFGRARRTVELILAYLRERSPASSPFPSPEDQPVGFLEASPAGSSSGKAPAGQVEAVRGYRSGYLPQTRREIERGLRLGQVRAVIATNALELGIDVGGMGAALLAGYPGTIAATWQQAGRAGRGSEPALAVLVTTAAPLDQFLAHHPAYFFERSPEHALINPDNLLILLAHLRCAAFELPFRQGEPFGRLPTGQVTEFLQFLVEEGVVHPSGDRFFWMADRYPSEGVSLRSASAERVLLQAPRSGSWATIGEVDSESAAWMVHPQAVYLHEAQTYLVEELDLVQRIARLQPAEIDYYTEPKVNTSVQLLEILDEAPAPGAARFQGEILVTRRVTGFRKIKWFTHETLAVEELSLPPSELLTTAYWLALAEETVARLREQGLWSNDANDYGPNWELQRALARARDDYRCQVCGALEEGRAHDVHHKVPFRTFASYEQANQLHNLATLCPPCHHRVEASVRVRSGLAGLAYALGNLAPFFLMCDVRDLGIHSDPQSPLAGGTPTVVIFDQAAAGVGLSQRLFELHGELIGRALELVAQCECADGCPSCVGPAGENGVGGKRETLALLAALSGAER